MIREWMKRRRHWTPRGYTPRACMCTWSIMLKSSWLSHRWGIRTTLRRHISEGLFFRILHRCVVGSSSMRGARSLRCLTPFLSRRPFPWLRYRRNYSQNPMTLPPTHVELVQCSLLYAYPSSYVMMLYCVSKTPSWLPRWFINNVKSEICRYCLL